MGHQETDAARSSGDAKRLIGRRTFLKLGAAGGALAGACPGLARSPGPVPAAVVVTDISALTDVANLSAVLETFIRAGLPVTCALRPPSGALDGFDAIVRDLLGLGPGVEIALDLPDLAALSPHFQARAAFEAQKRLAALTGEGGGPVLRTALCDDAETLRGPVGVRSAGIRNVLVRPDGDAAVRVEAWPGGVVRFFGGSELAPLSATLPPGHGDPMRLVYISADSFAEVAEDALRRWAEDLASAILDAELSGAIAPMPVSEIQFRDDFGFARYLAIRLLGSGAAVEGFAARLDAEGIPVRVEPAPGARGYWVAEPTGTDRPAGVTPLAEAACRQDGTPAISGATPRPSGIAVLPVAAEAAARGLNGCAMLELGELRLDQPLRPGTALIPGGPQDDMLLTISAEALGTAAEQRALVSALADLQHDGITRVLPLDRLVNGLLSHDPIERRFRRTRAAEAAPEPAPLSEAAAEAYLDDARRAWAFFETFTNATTGLCPATGNVATGGDTIDWVTMWDVGSQINALIAAHRLGLIDADARDRAGRRILFQIAGRPSEDRLLPHGVIRTNRVRSGSVDFDGCDAGRLLVALDTLSRNSGLGDEVGALVASWDLDQIVIGGEVHSVTDGKLHSAYLSHCAHYAARGFGLWGLEAASPYRTMAGRSRADGEMALLEAVAGIGPLGAEPLLLEAIELGMSAESAWLAEVLHVAQIEEHAASGRRVAVSEMPISRPPWFVYLGLQLGREPREWGIDVVGGIEEYQSKAFLEETMAVSSKAAYLWAAYRPDPYADALVDLVRAEGRLKVGFASSVGRAGGGAATFTDLNTNAIILQAIAQILTRERGGD